MTYAVQSPSIGLQQISFLFTPDTTQRVALGTTVDAVDPYWGGGRFVYLKVTSTVALGACCVWNNALGNFVAVAVPNAANQAMSVCFALAAMTTGQFGWFQIGGLAVSVNTASVAAGSPMGITGVGTLGASSAGKEIEGCVAVLPPATTVVKTLATLTNGSTVIQLSGAGAADGWFPGVALSGTGVGAAAVISSIAADGRSVVASVASTAGGSATVTGTYTGYEVVQINNPFAQGRIT